ncbi:MAG: PAS domain S-box protein [Nitrospirota bacterium]
MGQSSLLKNVLLIAIGAIILFPLYAIFIEYPAFEKVITENTSREAVRIATILSSVLIDEAVELRADRLPKAFLRHIQQLQTDTRIIKLKIFNPSGTIVYSTNPGEIGRINEEDYFHRIVSTGDSKVQEIPKNTMTLENQMLPADVVETYVPIMKDGKMIGIFEIYYDISTEKNELRSLARRTTGVLVFLAAVLLMVVILTIRKAGALAKEQKRMADVLSESENRYRTLFEHAGDAIFILEGEGEKAGRIVKANKAAAAMHGYTVAELTGMKITDLDTIIAAKSAPDMMRRILIGEWIKTELHHRRKDGTEFPVEVSAGLLEFGGHRFILAFDRDITERRQIEEGREKLIRELREALESIKTLKGLLPICASCKKIRDDTGYWNQIESYVATHSEAEFSHSLCPACAERLYPGFNK